jgi:hypothetical protein
MPRKTKSAPPAAALTFAEWKAEAAAALQRRHDVSPGTIPERVWKQLYVKALAPNAAADRVAVSAYNTRPAFERKRQRLLPR